MPTVSEPRARGHVVLRVHRYSPETGRRWVQEYRVPLRKGLTVLEALLYVKERLDSTLSLRYSCRMGACGSCGMLINGVPRLACQTQVSSVARDGVVEVAPLPGYPVVRDLVVDMTRVFRLHASIKPTVMGRGEPRDGDREFIVKPEEHLKYLQFSLCIMCGLCNAACPVYNSNPRYMGPMVLTAVYRWVADPRDGWRRERIAMVSGPDGCWACHLAASCSAVCPKAVDPAGAIQRLRRAALAEAIGLGGKRLAPVARGPVEKPLRRVEARAPTEPLLEGVDLDALEEAPPIEDVDPVEPPRWPLAVKR